MLKNMARFRNKNNDRQGSYMHKLSIQGPLMESYKTLFRGDFEGFGLKLAHDIFSRGNFFVFLEIIVHTST